MFALREPGTEQLRKVAGADLASEIVGDDDKKLPEYKVLITCFIVYNDARKDKLACYNVLFKQMGFLK